MTETDNTNETMDRRTLLKRGVGVAAAAGLLDLARTVSPAGAEALPGDERPASGPKRGGTLRYAAAGGALGASPDPAVALYTLPLLVASNCYDTLVRAGQDFGLSPRLAVEWGSSPDATVWTFKLRKGVKFHSGKPLTSRDVAYTITRILNPALGARGYAELSPYLKPSGITTPNATTIRFNLLKPFAFLATTLANIYYAIVPYGATSASLTKDSGSGPFKMTGYNSNTFANFERFNEYWESGRPYLDGVRISVITEDATRIEALLSGNEDFVDNVTGSETLLVNTPKTRQIFIPYGGWVGVMSFGDVAPFKNPAVAEAMKYAADRKKIMNIVAPGVHIESADTPIPPKDPFYPAGLKPRPYDPELSKHLLKKAGHGSGLTIKMYCYEGDKLDTALGYKSSAGPAGINVNIAEDSIDAFFSNDFLKKPCIAISVARLHVATALSDVFKTGGGLNMSHYSNAKVDQQISLAAQTTSVAKQKLYYGDAIELINKTASAVIPGWEHQAYGASRKLHGVTPRNGGDVSLEQAYFA